MKRFLATLAVMAAAWPASAEPRVSGPTTGKDYYSYTITFPAGDTSDSEAVPVGGACRARAVVNGSDVVELWAVTSTTQAATAGTQIGTDFTSSTTAPTKFDAGTLWVKGKATTNSAGENKLVIDCSNVSLGSGGGGVLGSGTIAEMEAYAGTKENGDLWWVEDNDAGDCSTAAGTGTTLCAWNGATWEPAGSAGAGLANVVEDLTPQLGGDLDMNGNEITSKVEVEPQPDTSSVADSLYSATNRTNTIFNIDGLKQPVEGEGGGIQKTKTNAIRIDSTNLTESEHYGQFITALGGGDTDLVGANYDVYGTGGSQANSDEGYSMIRGAVRDYWITAEGTVSDTVTSGAGSQTVAIGGISEAESRVLGENKWLVFAPASGACTAPCVTVDVDDIPPGVRNSSGAYDGGDASWSSTTKGDQGKFTLASGEVASVSGLASTGWCFASSDSVYDDINGLDSYIWLPITDVTGEVVTTRWQNQGYEVGTPRDYIGSEGASEGRIAPCAMIQPGPTFNAGDLVADSITITKGAGFPGAASASAFVVAAYPSTAQTGIYSILANSLGTMYGMIAYRAVNLIDGSDVGGRFQGLAAFYPTYAGSTTYLADSQDHGWQYGLFCPDGACATGFGYRYTESVGDEQAILIRQPPAEFAASQTEDVIRSANSGTLDLTLDPTDGWGQDGESFMRPSVTDDSINSGIPNGSGTKVHWSQLLGVPAGFADNTDDGAGGGDQILIDGGAVTTSGGADFISGEGIILDTSGAGDPLSVDVSLDFGLGYGYAGGAERCFLSTAGTGSGGFVCEGSSANTTEWLMTFPPITDSGTDTERFIPLTPTALLDANDELNRLISNCAIENDGTPIPDSCVGDGTDGGGGGYATIDDEDTPLTQRTTINFEGAGVTCADDTDQTTCTITGGGASALDDLSDVAITTPATGATLVKSGTDWVDGQLDLADTDAVTGVLPTGNVATTLTGKTLTTATLTDPTLTLADGTAPTPTTDGQIEWENDDDHIIVGDGTDQVEFVPSEDVTGDIAMTTGGAVTIQANSVALGTDTTGNYATSSSEGGAASSITIADNESTSETNAVLFSPNGDLDGGDLTPESDGDFTYNPSTGTVSATALSAAASSTPTVTLNDLESSSEASDATIVAQATDTGAGTEDVDVTISTQVNSTLTAKIIIDADGATAIANGATSSGILAILEDTDAGSNYASFQVPSLAANTVYTLPADDGDAGEQLQTNGSGTLTWEAAGSGSGAFSDASDPVVLNTTTKDVVIGTGAVNTSKLTIDGDADQVQLTVQGNGTQTDSVIIVENSGGTEVVNVEASGLLMTAVGLDAIGAVDMDYGSADVTDHTFVTDGTGNAEVVLPDGSIGSTEILDGDISEADLKAVDTASDEECLTYETTTGDFEWQACAGGSFSFNADGDNNSPQTISDTNELLIAGTANGIDTTASATDTITVELDLTELNTVTFGSGTFTALAFNAGATDPTFTMGSDSVTVTNAATFNHVDGSIPVADLATEVRSMYWGSAATSSDGTNCANPAEVTINSGPKLYTTICADNDGSTIYGSTVMPDGWDGGTVTFEANYIQTAADTSALNSDIAAQCRGNGEVPSSTWGTEVAIDDAAVVGSNSNDHTTSGAVTPAGTCAAGDTLYWRWQMDATGTTTAVATLHMVGFKMEYTTGIGD